MFELVQPGCVPRPMERFIRKHCAKRPDFAGARNASGESAQLNCSAQNARRSCAIRRRHAATVLLRSIEFMLRSIKFVLCPKSDAHLELRARKAERVLRCTSFTPGGLGAELPCTLRWRELHTHDAVQRHACVVVDQVQVQSENWERSSFFLNLPTDVRGIASTNTKASGSCHLLNP